MERKRWLVSILIILMLGQFVSITYAFAKNHKPSLLDAKLTPYKGKYPNYYVAYAKYSDPDGDIPSKIVVYVDNACYPLGLVRITKKPYPGVESYEAFYQAMMALPPGEHKYYFYTEDGRGKNDRFPRYGEVKSPFVGVWRLYNRAPTLKEGGLEPQEGNDRDHFIYSVWYYDPEYYEHPNHPPKEVSVFVDAIKVPMKLQSGTPNNGLYIADYTFTEENLRAYQYENDQKDPKRHAYFFRAVDADGFCVYLPEDGYITGPEISYAKTHVSTNHVPKLLDPKVEPPIGAPNGTYTYYVTYEDEDDDPPVTINCVVNDNVHRMKLQTGSRYKGIYYFKIKQFLGTSHRYYFQAKDGRTGETRLPESGSFNGPVVVK
jgi:hypothetical protein